MKRLDKFSILIENEEMGREVKRIADKHKVNPACWSFMNKINRWYHFDNDRFYDWTDSPIHDVITFDQFKEMFEGEIIGYECPMDLYKGEIKAGSIFKAGKIKAQDYWYYYKSETSEISRAVPAEIVETWKPVYKQTSKTVIVGGKEWKVSKDGVTCIDKGFDPNDIEKLNLNLIVHIFGETATLSEIKNLVDTYKELNK